MGRPKKANSKNVRSIRFDDRDLERIRVIQEHDCNTFSEAIRKAINVYYNLIMNS